MTDVLVRIEGVSKSFDSNQVIKNVTFSIYKNEMTALIGSNAVGKTTLSLIIAGIMAPSKGEIYFEDKQVNISKLNKHEIQYIEQNSKLIDALSVSENIFLCNELQHNIVPLLKKKRMMRESSLLLEKVGLSIDPAKKLEHLTRYQKTLVEIASALQRGVKLIIMDLPSLYFSKQQTHAILDLLHVLKHSSVATLFIVNHFEDIQTAFDRVYVLTSDGNVSKMDGAANDVTKINRYPKIGHEIGGEALRVEEFAISNMLRPFSLTLHKGEILGITSIDNFSVSTLLRSLVGINKRNSGRLFLEDKMVRLNSPYDAIRNKISFLSDDDTENIFPRYNAINNISIYKLSKFSMFSLLNDRKTMMEITKYLDRISLTTFNQGSTVKALSSGTLQKIVLLRQLLSDSSIFIMDNPSKYLDSASKVDFYNIINNLVKKGKSVLLSSYNLQELYSICDRILIFEGGVIANSCTPEQFATQYF